MAKTPSSAQSFAPPRASLGMGGMMLALMAHGFLVAALTWGISWRSNTELVTASAELWGELPVEAAAPLNSQPIPAAEPTPTIPEVKAPDIVPEKAKAKEEADLLAKQKADATKRKAEDANKLREQIRQDQIKRMTGLAGATGAPSSTGTALQSAAPSSSYAGKVEAKIRPNITFAEVDSVQDNPAAEVEIRIAPDGTIVGTPKLVKSSGIKAWDIAVLRAIEKTETLPRDTDGRVPSAMTLVLRPKR